MLILTYMVVYYTKIMSSGYREFLKIISIGSMLGMLLIKFLRLVIEKASKIILKVPFINTLLLIIFVLIAEK